MKRTAFRLSAIVICLCLCLAVCGFREERAGEMQPTEVVARGRYVEAYANAPEQLAYTLVFDAVGEDCYYLLGIQEGEGLWSIWKTEDGGQSWQTHAPGWLERLRDVEKINQFGVCGAFTAEGDAYLSYMTSYAHDGGYVQEFHLVYANGGEITDLGYTGGEYINGLRLTDGGDLLVDTGEAVELWDPDYTTRRNRFPRSDSGFDTVGNILVLQGENARFLLYDLDSGSQVAELPYTGNVENFTMQRDGSGVIYHNTDGLFRVTMDGAITEQLVDGRLSSFGVPYIGITHLDQREDGSFLILCTEDELYKVKTIAFDADISTVPGTQLTVYALGENQSLRSAATMFSQSNPDVLVDFVVGMDGQDAATLSDTLTLLATQLLAGNGPDVLVLDGMPADSYIQKGALLDIGDVEEIAGDALLPNIVASAAVEDGAVYAIPTRFYLPYIVGEGIGDIDDLPGLIGWLETREYPLTPRLQKQVYFSEPKIEVDELDFFSDWCLPRWFGNDGALDTRRLGEDLQAIKRYVELQEELEQPEYVPSSGDWINQAFWWATDQTALMMGNVGTVSDFADIYSALRVRDGDGTPLTLGGDPLYLPVGCLGVNAQSAHREEARAFVGYALGEEMQALSMYDGLPVRRDVWLRQLDSREEGHAMYGLRNFHHRTGAEVSMQGLWLSQEDRRQVLALAEAATQPSMGNEILLQMVREEADAYLTGNADLTQVMDGLGQKLQRYLDESA